MCSEEVSDEEKGHNNMFYFIILDGIKNHNK